MLLHSTNPLLNPVSQRASKQCVCANPRKLTRTTHVHAQKHEPQPLSVKTRRDALLSVGTSVLLLMQAPPGHAHGHGGGHGGHANGHAAASADGHVASTNGHATASADPLDFFRNIIRPENKYTPVQAVVVLMDARSTLRDVKTLASTPFDSQERFKARSEWPGLATRLRPTGPAVPIVAALASGGDREQTIGQMYGGKAGEPGIVDNVYASLGKVLTISGRTIRREAQESPEAAAEAEAAVDEFLKRVPQNIADEAQAFRVQRAKEYGERFGKPLSRLNAS